jgi:hypothetical protein
MRGSAVARSALMRRAGEALPGPGSYFESAAAAAAVRSSFALEIT